MTVSEDYLAVAVMAVIALAVPIGAWFAGRFFRPMRDRDDPDQVDSYLMPGYRRDHSLYQRALTTYECGTEPVGDAMIQFHFQYYWYAIVFLVLDVAFVFLVLAGALVGETIGSTGARDQQAADEATAALVTAAVFLGLTLLAVWHVFRRRGRVYI